ncbi:helix-turn-helix domain-containing protein [Halococcus sediminicola]|uniref:hypothetical protein n=1 Tax=Halococcus sediminicola TaxID=1264579 RepID=UPI000679CDCA|nr:hypothetical protein [Halococcus sediminicola]
MSTSEPTDGESEADAETAAFIKDSSKRTAVLERLVAGPASAADVADRDAPSIEGVRGVSGTLGVSDTQSTAEELRDRGLVELLVDGDTRVYSLTAKGERILFTLTWDEQ